MKKLFLFCIAIFLGFLFSSQIINLAKFLFETIPFMVLYKSKDLKLESDRLNIVGVVWFIVFASYLTFNRFHHEKYSWKLIFKNMGLSYFILYFVHEISDQPYTLISGLFHNLPMFTCLIRLALGAPLLLYFFYYIYIKNLAGIQSFLKFTKWSIFWYAMLLALYISCALLNVGDYALYSGFDRIWRFWLIYPANYALLSMFCLSITKKIQPMQNVKEYYINGEKYDWVTDPKALEKIFHSKREKEIMNAISKLKVHSIVLDVGCGTGLISRHLGNDVLGVDINRWNVEHAKVHSEGMFMIGDCENLPVKACSVDLALCNDVLEHLPNPALAISEIKRVLKPKGILIVTVPSKSLIWKFRSLLTSTHQHSEPFHRNFGKKELLGLFQEFRVVELKKVAYGLEWLLVGEKNGSDRDNSSFE